MAGTLRVYTIGKTGVNVDDDPLELADTDLRQAQNTIWDPLGVDSGLRKRPGWAAYNTSSLAGVILGGINVPTRSTVVDDNTTIYIGHAPTS